MTYGQKLYEARRCPQCGAPLVPPHDDIKGMKGDTKCDHCELEIEWLKDWIALPKDT